MKTFSHIIRRYAFWCFLMMCLTLTSCLPEDLVLPLSATGVPVDLGLSVKWASCNVGAISPEDYGCYYAWGETTAMSSYSSSNSVTYGLSISELESRGIVGSDGNLTAAYDAATVNWGSDWRMPTKAEQEELRSNCTWSWTTQNGVNGYKVTGRNGNSIFLPSAGYRRSSSLIDAGSYGYYWSASPYSYSYGAYYLYFISGYYSWSYDFRYYGLTVRPVFVVVSISTGEATDITTNGATLGGVVSGAEQAVDCGVIYGTSSTLSSTSGTVVTTSSQGEYSMAIANLEANTTYYYCAYVVVDGEYKYGEVLSFTTGQEIGGHEAVDLGLSVKWASCNVGATSPEGYGDYFAWGETSPKSSYSSSVTDGLSILELGSRGIIGSDGNLTAEYDAATANWGGSWRMPTFDEMKELLNKCTWEWTTQNGVYGLKVTGPNGNSIFLPAAGCRYNSSLKYAGSYGYYWSATPLSFGSTAYSLYFRSGGYDWCSSSRYYGHSVRPVSE